ncbi:MAG: hypothetical protein R3E83_14075 [Burkholderiaceae bacterium]
MNERIRFDQLPTIDYPRHLAAGRRLRSQAMLAMARRMIGFFSGPRERKTELAMPRHAAACTA